MRSQFSLRQLSGRALLLVLCAQAASPVWAAQAQSTQKPAARGAAATSAPAEQFVDGIAAIVDKDVITLRELAGATNQARRELQTQKIQVPPDDVLQKQVLQRLIMERVQRHEAERMGIKIDDAQVDRAIATIAQRNRLSPQQVRAEVEKSGTTWADYRRSLSDEIRLDRMRQRAVDNSIVISDAEVDAYLKEQERRGNPGIGSLANSPAQAPAPSGAPQANANRGGPVVLALAQILVRVPEGSGSDQVATLRRKAEAILKQVRGGADFASVAAASSDGPEALDGGVMGARPEDGWPTLFISSVAKVAPGQVSDIVQSGAGFHILKVLDRQGGASAAPSRAQPAQPQVQPQQPAQAGAPQGPMRVTQTRARHILDRKSVV